MVSDDDAEEDSEASSKSNPTDVEGAEDVGVAPATTWTLEAQIAREEAQMRCFVRRCPCPEEANVVAWLEDAVGPSPSNLDRTPCPLQNVLRAYDLDVDALSNFSYSCYHRLWHAAGQTFGRQVQRSVGQDLYARGGIACMRLHYYMLSYAWRGEHFYPAAADRPIGVLGYPRNVEFAWDGIGSWLA